METLTSGVLLKLLKDMGVEEKAVDDVKNPVLLQIRSIIPVLAEGDLWPSQGFFLKVADSTQAMFVSLAPEEDEMVLCNKLQLGQFIYVEKLEAAYPVPVLKGVMPIPGRQPCIGDPQDLLGVDILEKTCKASLLTMRGRNDVKNKPRARYRSLSPYKVQPRERKESGASHSRPGASTPEDRRCRGMKPSCGDKDSDSDSTLSNPRRKSWSGITKTRSGEFSDCTVVKHEIKPVHRSDQSVCGSPFRSAAASYENNEENTSTRTRSKDIALATKPVRTLNKSKNSLSERNNMELLTQVGLQASPSDRQWETEILWDYLPLTLVKLGKEILRQKDVALLAAVEALQEAAAAERLLKCLSSFSELRLAKEDEQQDSIDKFFKLQDYMVESRGIIQSLTNISPLRSPEADSNNSRSIGEALKLAVERKRSATTWIKAAVASDLTLVSTVKPQNSSMEANNTRRRRNKQIHGNKPIGTLIARKQRSIDEVYVGLAAEMENQPDWVKGSALNTAADLAQALQDESRTWFLAYMENYLDGFAEESGIKLSDSQFAETMCQMKRLNDWLDVMEKRERSGNGSVPGSSELEACGRIKKKIYGILLKHVERTSRVLEKMTEI